LSEDGVAHRGPEDSDTEVMSRVMSRVMSHGRPKDGDADDTVESPSVFLSELSHLSPAHEPPQPMNFEGLAASLAAPKPPSDLELLLARRERSAITTLPGLHDPNSEPSTGPEPVATGETQPFDRKILAGHATVFDKSPSVIVDDRPKAGVAGEAERTQPTSIAPFAIDVPVEVAPALEDREDRDATDPRYKTVRIPRISVLGRRLPGILIGGGMALLAGGIVVLAAIRPSPSAAAAAAAMTMPSVELAAAQAPAAATVPDQPRAEPALVPVTGVIALRKPGAMLVVDGERKRVEGGKVVVSCGKHRLGAGRRVQTVMVPCGGTLTH
jgi:hypothetical protein